MQPCVLVEHLLGAIGELGSGNVPVAHYRAGGDSVFRWWVGRDIAPTQAVGEVDERGGVGNERGSLDPKAIGKVGAGHDERVNASSVGVVERKILGDGTSVQTRRVTFTTMWTGALLGRTCRRSAG